MQGAAVAARADGALCLRHEGGALHHLVHLAPALLARVRGDAHQRLDLGHARDDALHRQQGADVLGPHLAQRHHLILGARQHAHGEAAGQLRRNPVVRVGATRLGLVRIRSSSHALVHQDVVDVAVAQVCRRRWQHIVDRQADHRRVPERVLPHQLGHLIPHVVRHIVKLDFHAAAVRLAVGDALQLRQVLRHHLARLVLALEVLQELLERQHMLVVRRVPSSHLSRHQRSREMRSELNVFARRNCARGNLARTFFAPNCSILGQQSKNSRAKPPSLPADLLSTRASAVRA